MRVLLIALVAGLLGLSSCASLKPKIEKPKLAFEGIAVEGLALDGAILVLNFDVENPNSFELKVDRLDYVLKLDGREVGTGELSNGVGIEGKEKKRLQLPVRVRYASLISAVKGLAEKKKTRFSLEGRAKSGLFELPFDEKGELDLSFLN